MKRYLKIDEWNIEEDGFHADKQRNSESIFSIGNGRLGQRGNFEEPYTSDSLQGSYLAGVSFLDRTKVGWWKNGYPHFYSRIPNAPNWSGIKLRLIDEELNLAEWDIDEFNRKLHMKEGVLERTFTTTSPKGHTLRVHVEHFNSMAQQNLSVIKYSVESINYEGKISLIPFIDGNVEHESANFNEKMWNIIRAETKTEYAYLWAQTKREDSQVCCAITYQLFKNGKVITNSPIRIEKEKSVGFSIGADVKPGDKLHLYKYAAITTSLYSDRKQLVEDAITQTKEAKTKGWDELLKEHADVWEEIWNETDVQIEGDPAAQQAIRFNIFQLYQSYRGDDPRLNIGSKGFTGEKYGGNTYWNTELCCVPFFMLSSSKDICRNLLLYRYRHLPKAIENAKKLGFKNGAALYPMVTIDGEECHNEWEITFEEIHRNGIIAHAISQYVRYTGKTEYLAKYGLEVLIAICRFWSQRVSFSNPKQKYVLLGVTGPNEYENNVDNNWYTNYICVQCLQKAIDYLALVKKEYPEEYERIIKATNFDINETKRWKEIYENMYLPQEKETGIFIQQDGYLDKELKDVSEIPLCERPINQHWSWDRIVRSCFIKQSDVLLGTYLFYNNFDQQTIENNFRFYEPKTLHESSLSPFVHSILASRIGDVEKAYSLFIRAARMDLDDYNNEVEQGLHVTSMPGSWLAIVEGFAGMKLKEDHPSFSPIIPEQWDSYAFKVNFRSHTLQIKVTKKNIEITNRNGAPINIKVYDKLYTINEHETVNVPMG